MYSRQNPHSLCKLLLLWYTQDLIGNSYFCGTLQTQWEEYERRPEHRHPYVTSWDDMKKELLWQLGEEHLYIDDMYDKLQRAAQCTNETGKEFEAYLQLIQSNLLDLDVSGASNETQLIHRMRQELRSEIHAALYRNPTVPKDWPMFFEVVDRAESSIHLEHKSFSQPTRTSAPAKRKLAESTTNQNPAGQTSRGNHTGGNF